MKFPLYFSVCLLLLFAGCDLFTNEQPEIPGKLVFSTPDGNGNYQIYTSLTNGENRKQLTRFKDGGAYSPSWSPDGTEIVFAQTTPTTSSGYYITTMNADGSDKQLLEGEFDGRVVNVVGDNPEWSPDGNKIAYDQCINCELGGGNLEIFVYDFENNEITQLTDTLSEDSFPKWKSNFELFLTTDRDYYLVDSLKLNRDLYSINLNDQTIQRITDSGNFGTLARRTTNEFILIKPFNSENLEWFIVDLKFNKVSAFILPTQISKKFSAPVEWSKNRDIILIRTLTNKRFEFLFVDMETKEIFKVNEEPWEVLGFDWHYDENEF